MESSLKDAFRTAHRNPAKRFPSEEDTRCQLDILYPTLSPGFTLLGDSAKVFTIGSCFARNIEGTLSQHSSIDIPTLSFSVDKSEATGKANTLLNQYNPGTISQKILSATGHWREPDETIVEVEDGAYRDLSLPGGNLVTYERAVERRAEIDSVYEHLSSSDLVIITLGLIEGWFDLESETYINQNPGARFVRSKSGRYVFRRLGVVDSMQMLDNSMEKLISSGVKKILLTVSPVPLGVTFTADDAVVANSYSKSVLRICANELVKKYSEIDYFPSYEIVVSGGLSLFKEDNIHVREDVVSKVTQYMFEAYFPELAAWRDPSAQDRVSV